MSVDIEFIITKKTGFFLAAQTNILNWEPVKKYMIVDLFFSVDVLRWEFKALSLSLFVGWVLSSEARAYPPEFCNDCSHH